MSGAPSSKPQSKKELTTARTLNTVATIGAGHAIVASTPAEWRAKVPGRKKLVEAGWLNEPAAHAKRPLPRKLAGKMPKGATSAKIAAGAAAGGWLTLHGGELAGDIMARRSINNQISQLSENKGKVDSVKKNDQSMISKSEGAVSRNGHGKALDATGAVAAGVGGAGLYQAGKLNGKYRRADSAGFKYAIDASRHKSMAHFNNNMAEFYDATGGALSDGRKTSKEAAEKHRALAEIKNSQSKKMDSIAHKLKSGRNKYAVGGAALISAAGAERAYNSKQINKAYRRFDPEADRQRRAGLYTGVGVLGAGLAGREAANHFTTKAKTAEGKTVRGIVAKPGKGRLGLGLAAVAGASGAFGAHSYKSGLSTRNQPWT